MKTKCLSCGGSATTKMQNGGLITGAKKFAKQGPIKTIKTIRKALNKLTTRKTAPGCFGAGCKKMQAGGSLPKAQGGRNVILQRRKITGPIPRPTPKKRPKTRTVERNGTKQTDTPFGNFPKNMSQPQPKKMQNGGMIPKFLGPNYPKRPKNGVTKAIKKIAKKIRTIGRNGTKQTDTPFGNFLKDPRVMEQPQPKKMQKGGVKK